MTNYDYKHASIPSGTVSEQALHREMLRSGLSDCVLLNFPQGNLQTRGDGIVTETTGSADPFVRISFEWDLTPSQKSKLDEVVSAHHGYEVHSSFLAAVQLVGPQLPVTTSEWQDLGGVVAAVGTFVPALEKAYAEVVGEGYCDEGAELQLVERNTMGGPEVVVAGPVMMPAVGQPHMVRFGTVKTLSRGPCTYVLQGRLGAATEAFVRFVSISLFRREVR